jgi:glycosyltransferase involved in cell wall biosynthesis
MRNKNITFCIPSLNGGGAEKVTMLLANELCARGWIVTFLMSRLEGPFLNRLNKNIRLVPLGNKNISKNVFAIAKYLRNEKPTIFYSSMTYVNVIAGLATILAKYRGKIIFSEHSNLSTRNKNNPSYLSQIITFLAKIVYKRADVVVCVSEGVKEDLNKVIPDLKRLKVIYNPVENFCSKKREVDDKFKIISMGRMDKEKNFSLLIQAFSIVVNKLSGLGKNLELCILGEGYERENLKSLINKLHLDNKVVLPGFVNNPSEYLNSSDLFVLSSNREGFGNVIVEALSCGLPIISTDCLSGPSEILLEGKLGKLVPVNDVECMADAIIETISSRIEISTKHERMLRARDFSVEKIVTEYELLFEKYSLEN